MTTGREPTVAEEMEARSPFRSARVQEILRQIRERQIADLTPSEKALFTRRRKEIWAEIQNTDANCTETRREGAKVDEKAEGGQ